MAEEQLDSQGCFVEVEREHEIRQQIKMAAVKGGGGEGGGGSQAAVAA